MRKSKLRNKELLERFCTESTSVKEVLTKFGLRAAGGNYKALHLICKELDITLPIMRPHDKIIGAIKSNIIPDSRVFAEKSSYLNRANIKNRMIKMGIPYVCSICNQGPEWNGKPLTLQLDHINGIYNDNRLENLRIICPHCHSQTETFAGRASNSSRIAAMKFCADCGKSVSNKSLRCRSCATKCLSFKREKITWPSDEELISMIKASSRLAVSKKLGVSETAVRKRLKTHKLSVL